MEIVDITSIVKDSEFKLFAEVAASGGVIKAIKAEQASALSRKELDGLKDFVAIYGAKGPGLGQSQCRQRLDFSYFQVL